MIFFARLALAKMRNAANAPRHEVPALTSTATLRIRVLLLVARRREMWYSIASRLNRLMVNA